GGERGAAGALRGDREAGAQAHPTCEPQRYPGGRLPLPHRGAAARRGLGEEMRDPNPLLELTLARLREFLREPGALFWTFASRVLLAAGMGIAFGSRSPEPVHVAAVGGADLASRLSSPDLSVAVEPLDEAQLQLRSGKVDLVVIDEG